MSTSASAPSVRDNLIAITKTVQFSWFIGHVVTLTSYILYLVTYGVGYKTNLFFYKTAFLGVLESFGIILYQSYKSNKNFLSLQTLISDDNVQYTYDALIWLVYPKIVSSSLMPFLLFSSFHVLGYVRNVLLPALKYPTTSGIAVTLSNFIKNNNDRSLSIAANFELLLLGTLIFKALLFKKNSWNLLAAYLIFIKLRYERSIYTRTVLKSYEARIDGFLTDPRMNPQVKVYWNKFKAVLMKTFGTPLVSGTSAAAASKSR